MNERIVIAEDDESIRRLLEVTLASHGYAPVGYATAEEALAEMEREVPAMAIFDIMMAGVDGITAVRRMREMPCLQAVPVIMLTAQDAEIDKVVGLDAGADDYITKPFGILELCARIRAQLRRGEGAKKPDSATNLAAGAITLNAATREALLDGALLELTFKEFELLKLLMEHADRAMSRSELIRRIWGEDYCGETRTLDIHIATLRQKLNGQGLGNGYIKTVRGLGYRFVGGEVT